MILSGILAAGVIARLWKFQLIPSIFRGGYCLIQIKVAEESKWAVIDTGSPISILPVQGRLRLGQDISVSIGSSKSGLIRVSNTKLPDLGIKRLPNILLGMDLMKDISIVTDYRDKRVWISCDRAPLAASEINALLERKTKSVRYEMLSTSRDGRRYLNVNIGGTPFCALLDTACTFVSAPVSPKNPRKWTSQIVGLNGITRCGFGICRLRVGTAPPVTVAAGFDTDESEAALSPQLFSGGFSAINFKCNQLVYEMVSAKQAAVAVISKALETSVFLKGRDIFFEFDPPFEIKLLKLADFRINDLIVRLASSSKSDESLLVVQNIIPTIRAGPIQVEMKGLTIRKETNLAGLLPDYDPPAPAIVGYHWRWISKSGWCEVRS